MQEIQLKYEELTKKILGRFYEVANELGFGFMESVYRRSLAIALRQAGLSAEEEVAIPVRFRGHEVGVSTPILWWKALSFLNLRRQKKLAGSTKRSYYITYVHQT